MWKGARSAVKARRPKNINEARDGVPFGFSCATSYTPPVWLLLNVSFESETAVLNEK
jgi:hypothetical protein